VRFDHVALALERMTDGWPVLADALGGRYRNQGLAPGYSWLQVQFANGFCVETLHPETHASAPSGSRGDFVQRFLATRGVGPHHLTFLVDDLDAAISAVAGVGLVPGTEDRTDSRWQEALYGADQAHGVVLQLAQKGEGLPTAPEPPEGMPQPGYDHPLASLSRVVHAVRDIDSALALYGDALGATVHSSGAAVDGNHWAELGWSGSGRLRLLEARYGDLAEWVGDRTGRLRHLFFTFDDPSLVPGAVEVAESRWAIDADNLLGTRVVLGSAIH
jgi:catechol 2,3-dioxygenase-like lactoylglutathione lyase family enzyme